MRRSLLILLVALLAGAAIASTSYLFARRICVRQLAPSGDDLAWLRDEFHLSKAEMQRIRPLHEGYLPKCRENCARIAANLARNHHRWRTRHPNVSLDAESGATGVSIGDVLPASDPAPDSAAVATERAAAVRAAVERLPSDMREVVILCEWEDLSAAEAAAILGTTPKAIDNRLYRARNLLRDRLKKWL